MSRKQSFILYADVATKLELLDMVQRGKLMTAIFAFANGWDQKAVLATVEDPLVEMMFLFISESMLREKEKWELVCQKRSEAGKVSAQKKKAAKEAVPVQAEETCTEM